jgi:hypothetical protein|nr:MAG TPA: hypothetical protein [Caudoviricetes sp.]
MKILDTKILPKEKREKPKIKVLDKLYDVDNTKKTYDKLYELEKNTEISVLEKQNTLLELLLGKKALKEILDLDLSNDEYKYLVNVVVAAVTGQEPEEIEQTTEKK